MFLCRESCSASPASSSTVIVVETQRGLYCQLLQKLVWLQKQQTYPHVLCTVRLPFLREHRKRRLCLIVKRNSHQSTAYSFVSKVVNETTRWWLKCILSKKHFLSHNATSQIHETSNTFLTGHEDKRTTTGRNTSPSDSLTLTLTLPHWTVLKGKPELFNEPQRWCSTFHRTVKSNNSNAAELCFLFLSHYWAHRQHRCVWDL